MDLDIVTDKSSIREVEFIVTPITDDCYFSCYSCPVDGFNATIDPKTVETNINLTRKFGDDGICPSCPFICNGVIAFKGTPIITLIAGIKVIVGTVTTVKFVITTATNNDIITSGASDIIIPPIAMDLDIVTDESSIRKVEGIVTPITDDCYFSCYSCPVDGFNATK